jgi:hypothetical protein
VDPTGLITQGECAGIQVNGGPLTGSLTFCIVRTGNQKQAGITVTGSNPLLVGANTSQLKYILSGESISRLFGRGANFLFQNSNAECLEQLGGDFAVTGISIGIPWGVSYQHAGDSAGTSVYTYGGGLDRGLGFTDGTEYTAVTIETGTAAQLINYIFNEEESAGTPIRPLPILSPIRSLFGFHIG